MEDLCGFKKKLELFNYVFLFILNMHVHVAIHIILIWTVLSVSFYFATVFPFCVYLL